MTPRSVGPGAAKRGDTDVVGWATFAVIAGVLFALPLPAWAIEEAYAQGFYRVLQFCVTTASNLAPFAVIDLLIMGAVLLVGWRTAGLVRTGRAHGILAAVWEGIRRIVRAVALLAIAFLWMWGFNYQRAPLDRTLPPAARPSVADLRAVIAEADTLGARVRPGSSNVVTFDDVARQLEDPINKALTRLNRPTLDVAGRPKYSLILTPFFTWAGVDGMVDPFALETIVHPDLLPFERPFALAHEWAHLAGVADEAEASAVGWLACMNGGREMAYSASLYVIIEAGSALPRDVWRDVSANLDPAIRVDLTAYARRQEGQRPAVRRTAFQVYDRYLRANHVDDGVASYSRALSLILSPTLRDMLRTYRVSRDGQP